MPILLDTDYVNSTLKLFDIQITSIKNFSIKCDFYKKFCTCWGNSKCKLYFLEYLSKNMRSYLHPSSIIIAELIYKKGSSNFHYRAKIYPSIERNIILLPSISKITKPIKEIECLKSMHSIKNHLSTYTIVDVPEDGNCSFTAVKVAQGDENFRNKIGTKLTNEQLDAIKTLREQTANKMENVLKDRPEFILKDRPEFIQMLYQPGFWNSGIDGAVGIKVLNFVALVIDQPILVVTQEPDGQYRYWISETVENPQNVNLTFYDIHERNLEKLLNANPDAIKLFHNGIHFQAIVKNDSLPSEGI